MRDITRTVWIPAVLILFAPAVIASEGPAGLAVRDFQRFDLTSSPFSGPVETIVMTDHPIAARGSLTDVFVAVQNHSNDTTVSVVIDLELRYADGAQVLPFHLGVERTQTLGPDEGVGFFIFWQVPADAPLGAAMLAVHARVGRLSGGGDSHADNENPMIASDAVTFEVVP